MHRGRCAILPSRDVREKEKKVDTYHNFFENIAGKEIRWIQKPFVPQTVMYVVTD